MVEKNSALKQLTSNTNSNFEVNEEVISYGKDYFRDNQYILLTDKALYLTATSRISIKNIKKDSWGFSIKNLNILDCWIESDVHDIHFFDNSMGCNCKSCDISGVEKKISEEDYEKFKKILTVDIESWNSLRQKAVQRSYFSAKRAFVDEIFLNIYKINNL